MGGTLCKIGSPLLSFLLCSLCTPLQRLLKHKYGLTPKEDALINYLADKEIDFTPMFYNSAIPIKELFYFFVIAGNTFYEFDRIPNLFTELQNFHVMQFESFITEDLQKVRRLIRTADTNEGFLINLSSDVADNKWAHIKANNMRFTIDTIQSGKNNDISALQLRKMYAGEIVKLKLLSSDMPDYNQLFVQRLFKPEQYIPFYFVESDLDNVEDLLLRMGNMFYAYKVTRYRMIEYYSFFTDVEFMRKNMRKVESAFKLLIHLKNNGNMKSKCFVMLHELNQADVSMMSILKENLGDIK